MWLITTESIYSFTFSEALSVCSVRIGAVSKWTLGWILFFYLGEETNSTTMSKNNTNTGKTTTQSDMKDGLSIQVCVGQLVNKWMCSKNHWNWYENFWGLFWQCCLMLSHIRWQADSFLLSSWLSFVVQLRMQKQDNFIIINTKLRMWFG